MFEDMLQPMRLALPLGCAAGVLSLLLTRLMLWLLPLCGMLDKPDFARHIHTRVVPRGGGIGMLLSFSAIIGLNYLFAGHFGQQPSVETLKLLAPLCILLPLGVIDDRFGLKARTKFIFQILAAAVAWHFGFRMSGCFGLHFPTWLGFILTTLWIVAFINAFNMIDGVDGLAAGVGFISSSCMIFIALVNHNGSLAVVLTTFAFSLLGFLYYNWHPARLFMGDTGSMFIGYLLAASGLSLNAQTFSVASIGIPLLACGIPVLDIFLAVWRRIVGTPSPQTASLDAPVDKEDGAAGTSLLKRLAHLAERLGTADQSHIHHRLLRHFQNNQRKTTLNICGLALCLGAVGIACSFLPRNNLFLALVIVIGTFSFILNRLAFIELWNSTEKLYHNFQSAHTGLVISYVINPLWDLACFAGVYLYARNGLDVSTACVLRYTAILMTVMCFSRSYRVFWNFSVSDDYFRLVCTLILGFILACASDYLFGDNHIVQFHLLAAGMTGMLVILERLFFHYFRNSQIRRHAKAIQDDKDRVITAIVGVTQMTRLYRNLLATDIERSDREQVLGLIVTDQHFLNSYCFGMKVLGHIDDAGKIIREMKINRLVLAKELEAAKKEELASLCAELGVQLSQMVCTVEDVPFRSE